MQVAELDDWTPQAVLDRGLKLLSWMEQRWCFHFKSEEQKIDIIIVSISVAALIVIGAKLLGYQGGGGGDNDMIPWWNMLQSLF